MKTVTTPKISVLMSVYNSAVYLRPAIESILSQTFSDFEFIIIDNASHDDSVAIIQTYTDPRIVFVRNDENPGLVSSRNLGLKMAQGEYIAIMDSDDISLPKRFKKEVAFMDTHPNIGMCGSWIKTIGEEEHVQKYLTNPDDIKANLLFSTSFAHPSVMMRRDLLEKNGLVYNPAISFSEDYDMWARCSEYFKMVNIPEILVFYRVHKKSTFQMFRTETHGVARNVRRKLLKKLGVEPNGSEERLHNSLWPEKNENVFEYLNKQEKWLSKIIATNKKSHIYNPASLDKIMYEHWRVLCGVNTKGKLGVWKKFRTSPFFSKGSKKRYFDSVKILVKSMIPT